MYQSAPALGAETISKVTAISRNDTAVVRVPIANSVGEVALEISA